MRTRRTATRTAGLLLPALALAGCLTPGPPTTGPTALPDFQRGWEAGSRAALDHGVTAPGARIPAAMVGGAALGVALPFASLLPVAVGGVAVTSLAAELRPGEAPDALVDSALVAGPLFAEGFKAGWEERQNHESRRMAWTAAGVTGAIALAVVYSVYFTGYF